MSQEVSKRFRMIPNIPQLQVGEIPHLHPFTNHFLTVLGHPSRWGESDFQGPPFFFPKDMGIVWETYHKGVVIISGPWNHPWWGFFYPKALAFKKSWVVYTSWDGIWTYIKKHICNLMHLIRYEHILHKLASQAPKKRQLLNTFFKSFSQVEKTTQTDWFNRGAELDSL